MRKAMFVVPAALVLFTAFGAAAQNNQNPPPQSPPTPGEPAAQSQPSVAAAARKAREAKKTEPKNTKVFTNDNIPGSGDVNVVGTEAPGQNATAAPPPDAKATLAEQEQYWRERFAKARAKLDRDQAELDVMQREMDRLQLQYYPNDPQKQLIQSVTRSDINNQQSKIEKKKADIAADKADISNMEDELRHSGGDPGWAR
jgi:chromosome segregation ATPase